MEIDEAIEHLRENSQRGFKQTFDLIVRLKNIDMNNEKVSTEIKLPHDRGKEVKVGVLSNDREDAYDEKELEKIASDPKKARKFVKKHDFFFADAPLMPKIGKLFGKFMAPRGKMPKPVPPGSDIGPLVDKAKKSVRLRATQHPMIQVPVATEDMDPEKVKENVQTIFDDLLEALPKGRGQVKDVTLKLTMSEPIKLEGF